MWTWRVVSNRPLRVSHATRGFEGLQPATPNRAGFGEAKKTIAAQLDQGKVKPNVPLFSTMSANAAKRGVPEIHAEPIMVKEES
jgi:hypothetical protein